MAARVPSVINAAFVLGFVAAGCAVGFLRAPLWTSPTLAVGGILLAPIVTCAGLGGAFRIGLASGRAI